MIVHLAESSARLRHTRRRKVHFRLLASYSGIQKRSLTRKYKCASSTAACVALWSASIHETHTLNTSLNAELRRKTTSEKWIKPLARDRQVGRSYLAISRDCLQIVCASRKLSSPFSSLKAEILGWKAERREQARFHCSATTVLFHSRIDDLADEIDCVVEHLCAYISHYARAITRGWCLAAPEVCRFARRGWLELCAPSRDRETEMPSSFRGLASNNLRARSTCRKGENKLFHVAAHRAGLLTGRGGGAENPRRTVKSFRTLFSMNEFVC